MAKLKPITECPYCGHEVVLVNNKELYGRSYGKYPNCYLCRNCKASVGVHPDDSPLGILADSELKALKMHAHALFDPYWKNGGLKRNKAYKLLADKLGISRDECHFGYFDKDMLHKVIDLLKSIDSLE